MHRLIKCVHLGQLHRVLCWQTVCICFILICICTIFALARFGLSTAPTVLTSLRYKIASQCTQFHSILLENWLFLKRVETSGRVRTQDKMNEYSLRNLHTGISKSECFPSLFCLWQRGNNLCCSSTVWCLLLTPLDCSCTWYHVVAFSVQTPSPRLVVIATLCYNFDTSHTLSLILACTLLSSITSYPINFCHIITFLFCVASNSDKLLGTHHLFRVSDREGECSNDQLCTYHAVERDISALKKFDNYWKFSVHTVHFLYTR